MKKQLKELKISGGVYRLGYYSYEDHTAILYNQYVDKHGAYDVVVPEKVVDEGEEYTVVGALESEEAFLRDERNSSAVRVR